MTQIQFAIFLFAAASPLIKDMLTVSPKERASIERICLHWWVNEGYDNCLEIAEVLAAETPVRLDLLLSLVPQTPSTDKLVVVGDQRASGEVPGNLPSEASAPTRCHSIGSLMELDRSNNAERVTEVTEDDAGNCWEGDSKRKLETTPSMEESAAAGAKRKERSRRKDRTDERPDCRAYRSTSR